MQCNTDIESTAAADETALVPGERAVSLPAAATTFTLVNNRDEAFNGNFYNWHLQKHVDGSWHETVARRFSAAAGASLAPGGSHTWSLSIRNDGLERPVEPVTADETLELRALGPGQYAFVVVGSYGGEGEPWRESQPVVGYAAPFTVEGDPLELTPTNRVQDVARDGETVTVTVGADDPDRSVTVTRRTEEEAPAGDQRTTYVTESVYGNPLLRDVLAQFEPGVERVTVRTNGRLGTRFHRGATFAYEGTTFEVTAVDR